MNAIIGPAYMTHILIDCCSLCVLVETRLMYQGDTLRTVVKQLEIYHNLGPRQCECVVLLCFSTR